MIIVHHCGVGYIHAEYYAHHHCLSSAKCESQKCVTEDDDCNIAKQFKHTKKQEISKDTKIIECDAPVLINESKPISIRSIPPRKLAFPYQSNLLNREFSKVYPPPNGII